MSSPWLVRNAARSRSPAPMARASTAPMPAPIPRVAALSAIITGKVNVTAANASMPKKPR